MYEEHKQNILGYRINPYNTYENQYNNISYVPIRRNEDFMDENINIDLESFYPEIYKIVYPMIQKACMKNTNPITENSIDKMIEEIYNNLEDEELYKNYSINDLIRILLIRELVEKKEMNYGSKKGSIFNTWL